MRPIRIGWVSEWVNKSLYYRWVTFRRRTIEVHDVYAQSTSSSLAYNSIYGSSNRVLEFNSLYDSTRCVYALFFSLSLPVKHFHFFHSAHCPLQPYEKKPNQSFFLELFCRRLCYGYEWLQFIYWIFFDKCSLKLYHQSSRKMALPLQKRTMKNFFSNHSHNVGRSVTQKHGRQFGLRRKKKTRTISLNKLLNFNCHSQCTVWHDKNSQFVRTVRIAMQKCNREMCTKRSRWAWNWPPHQNVRIEVNSFLRTAHTFFYTDEVFHFFSFFFVYLALRSQVYIGSHRYLAWRK